MLDILAHSTGLWVTFSFILFVIIAFIFGRKSVTDALDAKIENIRKDIENAENLRVEAQEMLAQYQRKQRDAEKEAEDILKSAKKDAKAIQAQAEKEFEITMQRREDALSARLKRIEENAMADIRAHAARLAIDATKEIVQASMNQDISNDLIDQATRDIKAK